METNAKTFNSCTCPVCGSRGQTIKAGDNLLGYCAEHGTRWTLTQTSDNKIVMTVKLDSN